MTKRTVVGHLRLISSQSDIRQGRPKKKIKPKRETQLGLPHLDANSVIFVDVLNFETMECINLFALVSPASIVDLRIVPRLDIFGGSRVHTLRFFGQHKIHYEDLFGRLCLRSYRQAEANPVFWKDTLVELARQKSLQPPLILLFDERKLMEVAIDVLGHSLQLSSGKMLDVQVRPAARFG